MTAPTDNSGAVTLSVVVPMRDEAEAIEELLAMLEAALGSWRDGWELVAVDDGSLDRTWELLRAAATTRPWLNGLRLARGFGQHPATMAGLSAARGSVIAVMDADMQVAPQEIVRAAEAILSGGDLVYVSRSHAGEGFLRCEIGERLSGLFARYAPCAPAKPVSTFFAARREVVTRALGFTVARPVTPYHLLLGAPASISWLDAPNHTRVLGRSKYDLSSLVTLAADVFFGYTSLPERATALAAAAGPLGAAAALALSALFFVAGHVRTGALLMAAGGIWVAGCLSALGLLAGLPAARRHARGPLYLVAEAFSGAASTFS